MLDEKKEFAAVPLPLGNVESEGAASQTTFRGLPIAWIDEARTKSVTTRNAFGEDDISEIVTGKRHLIAYDGKNYEREEFLKSVFDEYKKYPYRVSFRAGDILRLGGN